MRRVQSIQSGATQVNLLHAIVLSYVTFYGLHTNVPEDDPETFRIVRV